MEIHMKEVMHDVKLEVKGLRQQGIRNWIGGRLIMLAAWVIRCQLEIAIVNDHDSK